MDTILRFEYWLPVVWGLVLLASWVGWGGLFGRMMGLERGPRVDWGLRAGWGISAVLVLGGWLMLLGACGERSLLFLVLVGVAVWGVELYGQVVGLRSRRLLLGRLAPRRVWFYAPIFLLLGYIYAGSIELPAFNFRDDLPAYLTFSKRILQTGTIIDPFNWRRLSTYGGQQFLHATILLGGTELNLNLLEMGLSKMVFAGLLLGLLRRRKMWQHLAAGAVVMLLLVVPVPRANTQAQMTGVVLFVTLLRTLGLRERGGGGMGRLAVGAGVVGAGLGTLRMNYVPAAVLAIVFSYAWGAVLRRAAWGAQIKYLVLAGLAFVVVLAPWSIVLYESSQSFYYPLMKGVQRPEYEILTLDMGWRQKAMWVMNFFRHVEAILWLAVLALLLPRRYWRVEMACFAAGLITTVLTVLAFTRSDFENLYRYAFPIMFGVMAVTIVQAVQQPAPRWRFVGAWILALAVAWVHGPPGIQWLVGGRNEDLYGSLRHTWTAPMKMAPAELTEEYRVAQAAMPVGEAVLAAVSFPSSLDFARNTIYTADMPGAVSPDPGMPVVLGGEAVKQYLKKAGINYVMYVDPDEDIAIYSRQFWRQIAVHPDEATATNQISYRFTLKFLDDLEELGKSEEMLFRGKRLRLIRLR